jgi:GTPase SAR1 family protein
MGEKTRLMENIDTQNMQKEMEEIHSGLHSLYTAIVNDHKEKNLCAGYADYIGETPMAFLNRAADKLERRTYKVGFAGGFSGGKSTLVNALLGEPNLLPANIGETTMSITVLQKTKPGVDEHVEVQYFTREQALRHVFDNARYEPLMAPFKDEVFKEYTDDKAMKAIKEVIAKLTAATDPEDRKKRNELDEFLKYLRDYEPRLGTLFVDKIENAPHYLTVDNEGRGLGHLLLIEQVYLFKNNPLFVQNGVEIIDLPGTDSVNQRQKEITHEYITQADAVVLVIEPKGFKIGDVAIQKELSRFNNEVRDKIFTVMNRSDLIDLTDLTKESEIQRLHGQVVSDTIVRLGLDPTRFYMTSAKLVELKAKKEKGKITSVEEKELEELIRSNNEKAKLLGTHIPPDWLPMMKVLYKDGGVEKLKYDLMRYLERDIRIERFKEIFSDIKKVYDMTNRLLEPELPRVRDLLATLKNKRVVVTEFVEKVKSVFYDAVSFVHDRVEQAVEAGLAKEKEKMDLGTTTWCERFNFNRLRAKLAIPTPLNIKMETITQAKSDFSAKFPEIVVESVVRLITDRLRSQLSESRLPEILKHFSDSLGTDYLGRYEKLLDDFVRDMKLFTQMRAAEETWDVLYSEMKPTSFGTEWTPTVEADFRKDLKETFGGRFAGYANRLTGILWRYYQMLIKGLMDDFERLSEELSEQIKVDPDRVSLPMDLVAGESDTEREAEYRIAGYFQAFDGIRKRYEKVSSLFSPVS